MPEIICGNNVDVMSGWPSDMIDLTVTSPPYDAMRTYHGYTFDFEKLAPELYRITKPGGAVVWVVADQVKDGNESGNSFRQALHLQQVGFCLHHTMIYQKQRRQVGTPAGAYFNDFEYIFVMSKGMPKTYNVIRDVKNATGGSAKTHHSRDVDGKLTNANTRFTVDDIGKRGRIWYYPTGLYLTSKDKIAYEHPAIFPEKLARDCIYTWSDKNDLVFDPFMGSGTTLKMAEHLGRRAIGIDVSEKYCRIARQRTKHKQNTLDVI